MYKRVLKVSWPNQGVKKKLFGHLAKLWEVGLATIPHSPRRKSVCLNEENVDQVMVLKIDWALDKIRL